MGTSFFFSIILSVSSVLLNAQSPVKVPHSSLSAVVGMAFMWIPKTCISGAEILWKAARKRVQNLCFLF